MQAKIRPYLIKASLSPSPIQLKNQNRTQAWTRIIISFSASEFLRYSQTKVVFKTAASVHKSETTVVFRLNYFACPIRRSQLLSGEHCFDRLILAASILVALHLEVLVSYSLEDIKRLKNRSYIALY